MKRIALAAALILSIAAPVAAQPLRRDSAQGQTCAVTVRFGSYAMGIDQRAFERVQRYVASHRRLVRGSSVQTWGREGERTVCIATASRQATRQVFGDLRALVRQRAERGPTEIEAITGQVWQSRPAERR